MQVAHVVMLTNTNSSSPPYSTVLPFSEVTDALICFAFSSTSEEACLMAALSVHSLKLLRVECTGLGGSDLGSPTPVEHSGSNGASSNAASIVVVLCDFDRETVPRDCTESNSLLCRCSACEAYTS